MQTEQKTDFMVKVTNRFDRNITLCLEPWADEYPLSKGQNLTIMAQGQSGGLLEVEYGEDRITVYGWEGSTLEVTE